MTSLLIGCGNLGKIILEGFSKKKKKILVLEKNIKVCKDTNCSCLILEYILLLSREF